MTLSAQRLHFQAGTQALLHNVDCTLQPGEVHVLLGPNGAGKSTLLRLLSGELTPSAGTVQLNGKALAHWPPRRLAQHRAVLPQQHPLGFGFRVEEVVALGRLPWGDAGAAVMVPEVLHSVGAAGLLGRSYTTLSGGEQARVQLARVLAQRWPGPEVPPGFLLLDEPTASLDLGHQHRTLATVRQWARNGTGVLAVLHDPNLAWRYADRVTVMAGGRVVVSGSPQAVLQPALLSSLYGIDVQLQGSGRDTLLQVAALSPSATPGQ